MAAEFRRVTCGPKRAPSRQSSYRATVMCGIAGKRSSRAADDAPTLIEIETGIAIADEMLGARIFGHEFGVRAPVDIDALHAVVLIASLLFAERKASHFDLADTNIWFHR
jgi:hypothetical protein